MMLHMQLYFILLIMLMYWLMSMVMEMSYIIYKG